MYNYGHHFSVQKRQIGVAAVESHPPTATFPIRRSVLCNMVPQACLNPEAPEFFPNQQHRRHHQQQLQTISWPSISTPPQYYFVVSSPLSIQPTPHQTPLPCGLYYTATTPPSTSLPFRDGTNQSQQLCAPLFPALPSEGEEQTRPYDVSGKPSPLEVDQKSKSLGRRRMDQYRRANGNGFRLPGNYVWRRRRNDDDGCDEKRGHVKSTRQVFRRVKEYLGAFPKTKPCLPALPVRADGEETTIMIRNIPSKYTREMLLEFLDNHCMMENEKEKEADETGEDHPVLAFDFVYLPIDFKSGLNKGYAFVNFINPKAAWKFHLTANSKKWDLFQSHKIREVVAARLQGKEKLQRHFENMNFPCESEGVLPVCFSPPRDGATKGEPRTMGRLVKLKDYEENGKRLSSYTATVA